VSNFTQGARSVIGKVWPRNTWNRMLALALVLAVALALVSASLGRQVASAAGGEDHNANVTFTKWVTSPGTTPVLFNMAGVVSGDVGGGQYAGEILELVGTPATATIKALYHLNGSAHQFTARLTIVQDNNAGTATITGVVIDGWMRGARVRGSYQVIAPCGILNAQSGPFGDTCFQGTLHLDK